MKPFLTAEWRRLLILSFPVSPEALLPWVPDGTALDTHEGVTYLSLVGFEFRDTSVLGLSSPLHRNFEEVNLRFYVRRVQGSEIRRGVVFVREIVRSSFISTVARWIYNEPYQAMPLRGDFVEGEGGCALTYEWLLNGTRHRIGGRFIGTPSTPAEGSFERFVTERGWGFGKDRRGRTLEYRVDHPPWRIWPVQDVTFECDVAAVYDRTIAAAISGVTPRALVAEGSPITVYRATPLRA